MPVLESIAPRSSCFDAHADVPAVDICICTYRRPTVVDALRAVASLEGRNELRARVVVVDNAEQPEARAVVIAAARELGLNLEYVHAPASNISIARNACLEAGRGEWIAFLDDDEFPSPGWLKALLAEARRGEWDAVLGPVQAVYPNCAPHWLQAGDFHSTRPVFIRGRIETGYTGNVLIRRSLIDCGGLRFQPELGRSSGEDVDFFYRFRDLGGRIGFATDALVYEPVPPERANLGWLLSRSFRAGQTYGARLQAYSPSPFARTRDLLLASGKIMICGLAAFIHLPQAAHRNRFLTRAALHCGVVARLIAVQGQVPRRKRRIDPAAPWGKIQAAEVNPSDTVPAKAASNRSQSC